VLVSCSGPSQVAAGSEGFGWLGSGRVRLADFGGARLERSPDAPRPRGSRRRRLIKLGPSVIILVTEIRLTYLY
jgi:hypothetical protein